jgi:cytochrome c-type biogenesis protein CcsB
MLREPGPPLRVATATAGVGLAFHAATLTVISLRGQHLPFFNLFESLMFTAWVLVAIYLFIEYRYGISALGAFVCLVALGMLATAVALPKGIDTDLLSPALRSPWSTIHITSSLVSYACFALAFGASIAYLWQERLLKAKRLGLLHQHLPPLHTVDRLAYEMVMLGFFTLTVGIVTGALWAESAWGHYWSWDPKETWALVTWLVYAGYLHIRVISGWQGKWANRLVMTGFACVLVTYFWVSFFINGLHSYLGN